MFIITDKICVLAKRATEYEIYGLKLDRETKETIIGIFNSPIKNYIIGNMDNEIELISFKVGYELEEDELWKIDPYPINEILMTGVDNTDLLDNFVPSDKFGINAEGFEIKAIFVGKKIDSKYYFAFQNFARKQIIQRNRNLLIFSSDMFKTFNEFSISIGDAPDCFFEDGKLIFAEYLGGHRIFDLTDYYRIATSEEISQFSQSALFEFENQDRFDRQVLQVTLRKKVAAIMDSQIISRYSSAEIKQIADAQGMRMAITGNGRISIPANKKELKELLAFLSDKVYKAPLSQKTMISTSTRELEEQ